MKSRTRWAGHVAQMGYENILGSLVGKHEGHMPLGRLGQRQENNIKLDLLRNR